MPPNSIAGEHDVARHCTKKDFVDDAMTELEASSFAPESDDPDISVNWLDYYSGDLAHRIDCVCKDMSAEREQVSPIAV